MDDIYIVLQNKVIFKGKRFGAMGEALGELVFTTGMGSYIETLTDQNFYGQILIQTFPQIGNYGIIKEDLQSDSSFVKAYIVREYCDKPSNFRCDITLDNYLKDQGIVGVFNVDTRELTKIIRQNGAMNAKITSDISNIDYKELEDYKIVDALEAVATTKEVYRLNEGGKYKLALIDYGTKGNIVDELISRDCSVFVCPHDISASEILALKPDGVLLSDGPGNPAERGAEVGVIKALLGRLPIFGISLGHQLLALAAGGQTKKLKQGHRGLNQPVKCKENGMVYITNQNHGYAVEKDSLKDAEESFFNVNDKTNEGLEYKKYQAFSVQFNPAGFFGPPNALWLFDSFVENIKKSKEEGQSGERKE